EAALMMNCYRSRDLLTLSPGVKHTRNTFARLPQKKITILQICKTERGIYEALCDPPAADGNPPAAGDFLCLFCIHQYDSLKSGGGRPPNSADAHYHRGGDCGDGGGAGPEQTVSGAVF